MEVCFVLSLRLGPFEAASSYCASWDCDRLCQLPHEGRFGCHSWTKVLMELSVKVGSLRERKMSRIEYGVPSEGGFTRERGQL